VARVTKASKCVREEDSRCFVHRIAFCGCKKNMNVHEYVYCLTLRLYRYSIQKENITGGRGVVESSSSARTRAKAKSKQH